MIPTALILLGASGCQQNDASLLESRARQFRSLLESKEFRKARAMMSEDPRRWWGPREGSGSPWLIGPGSDGPWTAWDDHFRSRNEVVEWRSDSLTATVVMRETNDYFQLLERGWVTNAITYHFDDTGRIEGWSIQSEGERPPGRTDEFVAWARQNDPDELDELMPNGEIDPSGNHPERFRQLLNRWRVASGREPID